MASVAADGPAALADLVAAVARRQPDGPLDALSCAEAVVAELVALGDRLVGFYVEQARQAGHSWAEIGSHVGISRQAAQQRFAPRWGSLTVADLTAAGGLDRATGRLRAALVGAEDLARSLRHDAVDETHLLLALLGDAEALAVRAVAAVGADVADLERAVRGLLDRHATGDGVPPLSIEARRCLGRAGVQALAMGHNYVGTEHLLLGVLGTVDGTLARVLDLAGVTYQRVRAATAELLDALLRARD